jgi:hypothetical protein
MRPEDQQKLISKLNGFPQASKTLALLKKSSNNCNDDLAILKIAVTECGLNNVASYVLDSNASWAQQMFQNFPDLGEYERPLINKASELYSDIKQFIPPAEVDATPLQRISSMRFSAGAGYGASFTMWWYTPPFRANIYWQPAFGTPDNSKWVQSEKAYIGETTDPVDCSKFGLPSSPLTPGDTVLMIVGIALNTIGNQNTGFYYTYDPDAKQMATISGGDTVDSPSFTQTVTATTS